MGIAAALAVALAACGNTPGAVCVGGLVLDDGTCVAKCDPSKCVAMNACVDNQCRLRCDGHADCVLGEQHCVAATEDDTGTAITICSDDATIAGVGTPCPLGTECTAPLACVGSGVGDGNAYCTRHDCLADADCPDGYECGVVRDSRHICETGKGGGSRCGPTTGEPCVPQAMVTATGPFIEGPDCLLHTTCLKRESCASCATALDCSFAPGTDCVDVGGTPSCASTCGGDGDCNAWEACTGGACVPRFGQCSGSAFCEPCRDDRDCAALGPSGICMVLSRGQTACFDNAFPATCTTSADCPAAPSGLHGACFDETLGLTPADALYHHCWVPFDPVTNLTSCW